MPEMKRIIDLSTPLGPGTRLFPGITPITCEPVKSHSQNGAQVSRVCITLHSGTHMDAPLHFLDGAAGISEVELSKVCGQAKVIDLKHIAPASAISPEHLQQADPGLEPGDIAIINTGYEHYADLEAYCWIDPPAARWLVEKGIKCLAMDLLSTDPIHRGPGLLGPDTHPSHHILLAAGVILVECLVNLDALPAGAVFLTCLPLALEGCEASPARVVAFEFED